MPLHIENQTCYFDSDISSQQCPASDLTIITDSDKAMSAVEFNGKRFYITEAEADALTVAGATDGRKHLRATDSGSAI